MARFRTILIGALLAALLTVSACKRKKPPVPPPQAQAPAIGTPETPGQPTTPENQPPANTQPEQPQPEPTKPAPEVVKPKTKTRIAKKPKKKTPTRIIVDEGGTDQPAAAPPPPLVADSSSDAQTRQRQTEALLNTSEHDVASITRPLSTDEQAIVRHIHSYVDQSRQALKDGDVDRAYNLALKAHLLSDSLKK